MTRAHRREAASGFKKKAPLAVQTMWLLSQMKNGQTALSNIAIALNFPAGNRSENVSPSTAASLEDQGEGLAEPQESSAALPQSSGRG